MERGVIVDQLSEIADQMAHDGQTYEATVLYAAVSLLASDGEEIAVLHAWWTQLKEAFDGKGD